MSNILLVGGPLDGQRRPDPQEKWMHLHVVERLPKMPILDYDPSRPTTIPFTVEHYQRMTIHCGHEGGPNACAPDCYITFYGHDSLPTMKHALDFLLDHYKKES